MLYEAHRALQAKNALSEHNSSKYVGLLVTFAGTRSTQTVHE